MSQPDEDIGHVGLFTWDKAGQSPTPPVSDLERINCARTARTTDTDVVAEIRTAQNSPRSDQDLRGAAMENAPEKYPADLLFQNSKDRTMAYLQTERDIMPNVHQDLKDTAPEQENDIKDHINSTVELFLS